MSCANCERSLLKVCSTHDKEVDPVVCLDCKATPGGICAPHKLATSFDAPTDDEWRIEKLLGEIEVLREELAEQVALVRNARRPHFRYLRNGMVSA